MSLTFNGTTDVESRLKASLPEQPRERFFDANGVGLRYVTAGTGEPVLLLHGITRTIEADWIEPGLFEALTEEFRVIALDQRGHGRSDTPGEDSSYGMEMVHDVFRLLDHLQMESAHVIGYSMGGRIALKAAEIAPTRLRSIVLAGSGGVRHQADLALWNDLASSLEHGGGIQTLIRAIWPTSAPRPTEEQLDEISRHSMDGNQSAAIAAASRGFVAWRVSDAMLRSNGVPALAVVGSEDPNLPAVTALREVMGRLDVAIIEGADHINTLGHPDFIRTVKEFLNKQ